jgi:hypothetical protein
MGEVGELEKRGRNDSFNYSFIRDVDVANALRPLLAEEGVSMFVGMDEVRQERITSGGGSEGYHTLARMSITFADGETGETYTVPWYGEANDYQDKGVNKAATLGLKYALMKTFLIGSEDDPDAESTSSGRRRSSRGGGVSANASVEEIRAEKLAFGKPKGKTWGWVVDNERGYVEWLAENSDYPDTLNKATKLLAAGKAGGNGSGGNGSGASAPSNGSGATSTDFWRTAKQMKAAGILDDDEINAIKSDHQGSDGIDWGGAIEGLKEARRKKDDAIPF